MRTILNKGPPHADLSARAQGGPHFQQPYPQLQAILEATGARSEKPSTVHSFSRPENLVDS